MEKSSQRKRLTPNRKAFWKAIHQQAQGPFTHATHGVPLGAHAVLNIGSKPWLCHSAGSLDTSRGGLVYQEALCQRNSAQKSISYGLDGKGVPARAGPISIKGR